MGIRLYLMVLLSIQGLCAGDFVQYQCIEMQNEYPVINAIIASELLKVTNNVYTYDKLENEERAYNAIEDYWRKFPENKRNEKGKLIESPRVLQRQMASLLLANNRELFGLVGDEGIYKALQNTHQMRLESIPPNIVLNQNFDQILKNLLKQTVGQNVLKALLEDKNTVNRILPDSQHVWSSLSQALNLTLKYKRTSFSQYPPKGINYDLSIKRWVNTSQIFSFDYNTTTRINEELKKLSVESYLPGALELLSQTSSGQAMRATVYASIGPVLMSRYKESDMLMSFALGSFLGVTFLHNTVYFTLKPPSERWFMFNAISYYLFFGRFVGFSLPEVFIHACWNIIMSSMIFKSNLYSNRIDQIDNNESMRPIFSAGRRWFGSHFKLERVPAKRQFTGLLFGGAALSRFKSF